MNFRISTALCTALCLFAVATTTTGAIPISSIENLQLIGNHPNYPLSGNYYLTQNIDASATAGWNGGSRLGSFRDKDQPVTGTFDVRGHVKAGFHPIGDEDKPFTGTFDGRGHIISGLAINRPEEDDVGLFGYLGTGATVKNVGLEGGEVAGNRHVGGLVGRNRQGTVQSCYANAAVNGDHSVGGIVGHNWRTGEILSSYAEGEASGRSRVGGLAGYNFGLVAHCYSVSIVKGQGVAGGGLVNINPGHALASFWDMEASGQTCSGGGKGLTSGQMRERGFFQNAGWAGTEWVMPQDGRPRLAWEGAGGDPIPEPNPLPLEGRGTERSPYRIRTPEEFLLLGWHIGALDAHIALAADLDFEGMDFVPIGDLGHFGGVFDGRGRTMRNIALNRPGSNKLGVFRALEEGAAIRNLGVKESVVRGSGAVGGLVGRSARDTTVSGCHFTGQVAGSSSFVGGLVGNSQGAVSECRFAGEVKGRGDVGGLLGASIGEVAASFAAGTVSGHSNIGGLVGRNEVRGTLSSCYATGEVRGPVHVGGLVGWNRRGTVTGCYATGEVRGSGHVGGLVGFNDDGRVSDSYWDVQASGRRASDGGEGRTTAQMTHPHARGTYAGWDFRATWAQDAGAQRNRGYPYLRNAPALEPPEDAPAEPEEERAEATPKPFPDDWPFDAQEARRRQEETEGALGIPLEKAVDLGGVRMEMVLIPAGEFMMGSPDDEEGRWDNEGPQHLVRIEQPFYMGKHPVTQSQWQSVMGSNPARFGESGGNAPVETVSWNACQEFVGKLSEKEGVSYRMPTEAEWEYACRAGTTTRFYTGDSDSDLDAAGWYRGNSGRKTHPVGGKQPNAWGLYDMHGNVWEWTQSLSRGYPYSATDGRESLTAVGSRVLRGGSWDYLPGGCRSAVRYRYAPPSQYYRGFRLSCPAQE